MDISKTLKRALRNELFENDCCERYYEQLAAKSNGHRSDLEIIDDEVFGGEYRREWEHDCREHYYESIATYNRIHCGV